MKSLLALITFFCINAFAGDGAYTFVKNFEIKKIELTGSIAKITVVHPEVFGPTRFELIPNNACLESFPPQCSATVVRLDDQPYGDRLVKTSFEVDLDRLYQYGSPTYVTINGPKKAFQILY